MICGSRLQNKHKLFHHPGKQEEKLHHGTSKQVYQQVEWLAEMYVVARYRLSGVTKPKSFASTRAWCKGVGTRVREACFVPCFPQPFEVCVLGVVSQCVECRYVLGRCGFLPFSACGQMCVGVQCVVKSFV